jgi:hypothetical protein
MWLAVWNIVKGLSATWCACHTLWALYKIPLLREQLRAAEALLAAHRTATEKARQIGRSLHHRLNVTDKAEPYLTTLLTELDTALAAESTTPPELHTARTAYSRDGAGHLAPDRRKQ